MKLSEWARIAWVTIALPEQRFLLISKTNTSVNVEGVETMRNPLIAHTCAVIMVIQLSGCQSNTELAEQELAETFAKMGESIAAGDLDSFVAHYAESPLHLPPGAPRNKTRNDVKSFLQGTLGLYMIHGEPDIRYSDDASMAYVYGTYETRADESRGLESYQGRFITIWQRTDGGWRCVVDIWNTDDQRFAHL